MKKTGFWKGLGLGLTLSALIAALGVTAVAANNRTIQVEDGIRIQLNGSAFTPRDAKGNAVPVFIYNGTTYAPVRAISEAAGYTVGFNSATRTVTLTGGQTAAPSAPSAGNTGSYITADRAKEIALADAGLSASAVTFIKCHMDWDDGRMEYDVEFWSGSTEYDYTIDAASGRILSADRDVENFIIPPASTGSASTGSTGTAITAERAQQIALAEVPGGTVLTCHLDWDDGRQQYEITVIKGDWEYDFDIDASSGRILSRDMDSRWD